MRRIVFSALSTLSVLVLLLGYHTSTSGPLATGAPTSFVSGTSPGTTSSPPSGSTGSRHAARSTGAAGSSGQRTPKAVTTMTGEVVQTRYGPVQVQLGMSGSTIDAVQVLQYPRGNQTDVEINSRALPILIQETMDQQSAGIDMVSGATYTSQGYLQSLQSALDQAGG